MTRPSRLAVRTPNPYGRRRDSGAATLELVVLAPVVILLTFAIVQAAVTGHARSLALAAAQAGVDAGRSARAAPGAGPARAQASLTHAGDTLRDTQVSDAGTTPDTVRVTVTAVALSVIPGLPGTTVRATARAPRERFTTRQELP